MDGSKVEIFLKFCLSIGSKLIGLIFFKLQRKATKREKVCDLLSAEVYSKVHPMRDCEPILTVYLPQVDKLYRNVFTQALKLKEASYRFHLNHNIYDRLKGVGSTCRNEELNANRREFANFAQSYKNEVEEFIQNQLFETYKSLLALFRANKKTRALEEIIHGIIDKYDRFVRE